MFSEYTGFYFYSSLLQAQAAIFSIVGVFVVFKIQMDKSSIEFCKERLLGLKHHETSLIEFENSNQGQREEKYIREGKGSGQLQYKKWNELENDIALIKSKVKLPILWLIINMIVNTGSLMFSSAIHNSQVPFANATRVFFEEATDGGLVY